MEEREKRRAKEILSGYLAATKHRRTPERFAVLNAIYDMDGEFSIDELGNLLERKRFRVSRATLYNSIRLFLDLHLVVRHSIHNNTRYSAALQPHPRFQQICSECGRIKDVDAPKVFEALEETKLKRFHRDYISIYAYGICSSCQGRITRRREKRIGKLRNKTQ
ncbi:MAG: transcriptional repressor [Prevotella sp.]|nr:transcriptional repressor [Prevotella sp.]MBR7094557.1 transcriptional repressor [Prevotella sp.]